MKVQQRSYSINPHSSWQQEKLSVRFWRAQKAERFLDRSMTEGYGQFKRTFAGIRARNGGYI